MRRLAIGHDTRRKAVIWKDMGDQGSVEQVEKTKEPGPLGEAGKERPIVTCQPAIEGPVAHAFEGMQQPALLSWAEWHVPSMEEAYDDCKSEKCIL